MTLAGAKLKYAVFASPPMPLLCPLCKCARGPGVIAREHQERTAPAGSVSGESSALVHTPVPIQQAMGIPQALESVDFDDWRELSKRKSWLLGTVQPRAKVIEHAKREGQTIHSGSLQDLCHVTHSAFHDSQRTYKGHVVLGVDIVREESGFYAMFSEQGTSASHIVAAKCMNAIARVPGCSGEDFDAIGAYTQVGLDELKSGGSDVIETWISLPRSGGPKEWDNMVDHVYRLCLNLYGHPLAGLYWEQFCPFCLVIARI